MSRFILAFVLALSLAGCSWLDSQSFDVCMTYKGRHVCVGRYGGVWTFKAAADGNPVTLSPLEEEEIKREVSR